MTLDGLTFDPHLTNALGDFQISQHVYDRIVEFDEHLQLGPGLAESWRAVDEKTWEFKLRQGVTFHDGSKFNAAAAKFNFDRILSPETGSPRKGEIPYVSAAEVVDDLTLRLKLSDPFSSLPYSLAGMSGAMVSPDAIHKYGKDLARNPVGSGPFAFVEWVTGDHITLKRNENYWKPNIPLLDQLVFRGIQDSTVRLNALQSGAVQVIEQPNPKDLTTLKNDSRLGVVQMPGLGISSIRLRLDQPPFDKLEVRQAMSWSLDRDLINQVIYSGTGVPAQGFLAPPVLGYDPSYQPFPRRDVAQAKAKLASAGLADGFSFSLLLSPDGAQVAQALKDQMADAGMTMNLEQVDSPTLLDRQVKKQFSTIAVTYSGAPDPFAGFTRFFSAGSPLNLWSYMRPELDALFRQAAATAEPAARAAIYTQANKMVSNDLPWIFLRHEANSMAYDKRVQNPLYMPDKIFRFWNTSLKS